MNQDAQGAQAQPDPQALIVLPPAARAAVAIKSEEAEKDLLALVARSADIKEVTNADGREQVHRMAMDLRNARCAISNTSEAARADATAFSKAVIAEEKRLLKITADEEARVFKLRDDFDAKLAAEKAEKERIEAARKAAIRAKIDAILRLPAEYAGMGSADLTQQLAALAQRDVQGEGFEEFADEARTTIDTVAGALLAMRDTALDREDAARKEKARQEEAARVAAENARELARLNAELAERLRVEEEEKARREAKEKQERDAAAKREQDLRDEMEAMRAQLAAATAAANPAPAPEPELVAGVLDEVVSGNLEAVAVHAAGIDWDAPVTRERVMASSAGNESMTTPFLTPSPVETPRIDDSRAVAALLGAVRELYASRSPEEICQMVSDLIDELEAGEGK